MHYNYTLCGLGKSGLYREMWVAKQCFALIVFIILFALLTFCAFCGKKLVELGRKSWQCKQRGHSYITGPGGDINISLVTGTRSPFSNIDIVSIKCCCGKCWKGVKGLNIHHRSYKKLESLDNKDSTQEQPRLLIVQIID